MVQFESGCELDSVVDVGKNFKARIVSEPFVFTSVADSVEKIIDSDTQIIILSLAESDSKSRLN